ncbi:hypothetical protein [Phytohalomonas tamaricis]|uniref:hypothetical protein n=1 Tax=Phytohalomonas tamaricis TaxID=2081032 RepID=UPI000D0B1002|nr:hypothetical protein [Phytohalomonas tamaricis]
MEKRTELRISLDDGEINIPYGTDTSENGEAFPYRRLVDFPEQVKQIPEVSAFPRMQEALLKINQQGNAFESARILTWQDDEQGYLSCCALGFYFQDRALFAHQSNCMMLAGNLLNAMLESPLMSHQAFTPMLEIQRATLTDEDCKGWIMDLYLAGHSDEKQDYADDDLQQKFSWLADFLNQGI